MAGNPIVVRDHDPSWLEQFVGVADALRRVMSDRSIHPIGTTATPEIRREEVIVTQATLGSRTAIASLTFAADDR